MASTGLNGVHRIVCDDAQKDNIAVGKDGAPFNLDVAGAWNMWCSFLESDEAKNMDPADRSAAFVAKIGGGETGYNRGDAMKFINQLWEWSLEVKKNIGSKPFSPTDTASTASDSAILSSS